MKFIVHTDGGARGNPGPAAVGVVIEDGTKKTLRRFGKQIGETTNNVAEYTAVAEALRVIRELGGESPDVEFYLDSTLVVNQLNGLFKIKDATLRTLVTDIRILEQEVGGVVRYTAVPREQNRRADFLVNQALDNNVS
jgi:ribonuclease HI